MNDDVDRTNLHRVKFNQQTFNIQGEVTVMLS